MPLEGPRWTAEEISEINTMDHVLWRMRREDRRCRKTQETYSGWSYERRLQYIQYIQQQAEKGLPLALEITRRIVARKLAV